MIIAKFYCMYLLPHLQVIILKVGYPCISKWYSILQDHLFIFDNNKNR